MGTLGCVNDMLQRDKENRALRKIGRERMKETRRRLLKVSASSSSSHLPPLIRTIGRYSKEYIGKGGIGA